jgi:D-3-phosphoglycerate dehydrogenase
MKILIASPIASGAIQRLQDQHDVICAFNASEEALMHYIVDREVLIFRSGVNISAAVMGSSPRLQLLVRAGSGLDNVDLDYVRRHGIQLVRVPGPGARAVAEMTFALMLSLARNVLRADHLWRQGHWAKSELAGHLLLGKTLGIVGTGNIGTQVGKMGAAWGMHVMGCVENPSPERARLFAAEGIQLVSFEAVIGQADFVTIHVPLKETTWHMINADVLAQMKQDSFLINIARGGVVDEGALYDALTTGQRLIGAALDVHEVEGEGHISPLATLNNIILSPHIGAMAIDSQREIGRSIVEFLDLVSNQRPAKLLSVIREF